MSDFGMSFDQLENLSKMLDPAEQAKGAATFARPSSQKCGFSLAEAQSDKMVVSTHGEHDNNGEPKKPTGAPANPGLVPLPPALAHQQNAAKSGLPVPSHTREGRELAALVAGGTKAKTTGNDIWADEEVDPSFGAGAGELTTETRVAPPSVAAIQKQQQREKAAAAGASSGSAAAAAPAAPAAANTAAVTKPRRVAPEYNILYKHNVSAEDRFLGMDFTKDGSAVTADGIIVKIEMPLENSARDINLDVKAEELALMSPHYQVRVPLPMPVLAGSAGAKWDKSKHMLVVTLTADTSKREFKLM